MKKIDLQEWAFWEIDDQYLIRAYNEKLEFIGWIYFVSTPVILLAN